MTEECRYQFASDSRLTDEDIEELADMIDAAAAERTHDDLSETEETNHRSDETACCRVNESRR